jgi:hypothetical protein
MELTRVGEERKERPLEEGEAFTVPAGGPKGCAPRFKASFRGARDYTETGRSPSWRGRPWGLRRRWHAPGCSKGEP